MCPVPVRSSSVPTGGKDVLAKFGRRAPRVADAVPVLALSPKYRLVSDDRPAGAGGPALRAGGGPDAESPQPRRVPGAVWPPPDADAPPPGGPPLPAADGRLYASDHVA